MKSDIEGVEVKQVVETKSIIGSGTKDDPILITAEYWSFDGKLPAVSELDGVSD